MPSVPVIVSGYVPDATLVDKETVSGDAAVDPSVTGVGSEQVAPEGHPLNERLTVPEYPYNAVAVMVDVAVPTCTIVKGDGFAAIEKFGGVQVGNLKEPNALCQLKPPFETRYSFVYQKVQSSTGSMRIAE